ncbi:hypothetical protein [Acidocella aromatica]|uniref:Uncharacterized protein n=1 Tax=Acidocella aromatica TaxID=1303579 RepID=A0A840VHV7_9PROT|nr:hypothetical protein [Acidocella aromatica]MBB5374497.1 hypothetical protein [Acidocella aromatica]
MTQPTGRRYSFELDVEINDKLGFVPGELGTYLADALFELDHAGLLFAGLSTPKPGERLLSVAFRQTGYARGADAHPVEAQASYDLPHRPEDQRELLASLEDAVLRLSDLLRDSRLLKAKADATRDALRPTIVWTKTETKRAEQLLTAITSLLEAHATHTQPLL